jgi:hypothetical protein
MESKVDADVSPFVRNPVTGRLVFSSKAIKALSLSPAELTQRGYPLDDEIDSPANVPENQALVGYDVII